MSTPKKDSTAAKRIEATSTATTTTRIHSLADFRKAHDIPQKIRNKLPSLRGGYVTEEELRKLCEVPVQNWRRYAELPEFAPNKFKLDGVTYWAGVETITQMKQITGRA
jgi:hypothetical protein